MNTRRKANYNNDEVWKEQYKENTGDMWLDNMEYEEICIDYLE